MTDREIAIALSEYVIRLRRRIEIARAIIIERGIATPDQFSWEELAKLIPQYEDDIQRLFSSQLVELRQALPDQIPASEAIRVLHHQLVEGQIPLPHLP